MAATVLFDRAAADDIAAIRDYLTDARDITFANAFAARIVTYCESFGALPHRGTKRDDLLPGLRTVGWRSTITVAFRVSRDSSSVVILGVFYRGRDVEGALRDRA